MSFNPLDEVVGVITDVDVIVDVLVTVLSTAGVFVIFIDEDVPVGLGVVEVFGFATVVLVDDVVPLTSYRIMNEFLPFDALSSQESEKL